MSVSAESIEAFIPWYPDREDPDFVYNVSRKKELNDLYLETSEPVPEAGGLLETQMFMKRFFGIETPYTEALLFQGLGTGKSCVASAIVENFKNSEVGGRPRKPALVVVKSEDLARNIAQEITYRCTKDIYTPKPTVAEIKKGEVLSEETKVARLNRAVSKSYEIVTMETFLKNLPPDEEIKRRYSDRVIIVDEAHALRIQPSRKKKKKGLEAILEEIVDEEVEAEFASEGVTATVLYDQMHRLMHLVNGRKLLLTGTPIWDRPSEIASLMNLILPTGSQLPTGNAFDARYFNDDGTLVEDNIHELKDAFRGRVSFLRQMMTTAERIEMGTKEPWLKHITVYPDGLSETQAAVAREARDAIESKTIRVKGKTVEREVKGGTVLKLARDAMNMVIPTFDAQGEVTGVEYGPEAFRKYVVKEVKKRGTKGQTTTVRTYDIDTRSHLAKELRANLREYSAKFASIIEDIKSHPNEVTFIYNEEVTGLGGSIMLGLCLQLFGLVWAKTSSDIARPSATRRFAVITSDPQTTSQSKQVQELIASSNNDAKFADLPSNRYGDRLQVIIGSEKIALGLSIKNVRRIHIVMPHWNIPSIAQAEARGFRFGGHDALPPEERIIRIFRHISVEQPEGNEIKHATGLGFPSDASFTDYETTDVYIYKIAEEKEYRNSQIYRVLKEEAFDCAAFYRRNVLETDVDYTRECDYQECNYECDTFPPVSKEGKVWDYSIPADQLDYSTYVLFYASGRVKEIIDAVTGIFNSYFSLLIDTLQALLEIPDDEKGLLLQAIDTIINARVLIRNRYGFGSYLKESGNIVFLDSTIGTIANYPESTYIENPLVSEITSLDSLVEVLELDSSRDLVLKFCKSPSSDLFETIPYKTKILLLEAAYINSKRKQTKRQKIANDLVLQEMGGSIYEMKDGTPIHILYSEEFKGQAYSVAAKDIRVTGTMRRYDPAGEGRWVYVDSEQEEGYVAEIKSQISGRREVGFEDNPYGVFGWVSKKDGSFRINIKSDPGKKGKVRGKKCQNFDTHVLIDIFIDRLGYLPGAEKYEDMERDSLLRNIRGKPGYTDIKERLDGYEDEQLRGILALLTYRKDELCQLLFSWLEENGLLYTM
jgi:hypothetical protein